MTKGLTVDVYRAATYTYPLNELTETHDLLLLVGDGIVEVTDSADSSLPMVKLVKRTIFGTEHIHAEPVTPARGMRAFGGTFIYSTDGRFPFPYPIAVHDRVEF